MKKFFLVAAVILVACLIGLGVLLATFDADRYRPLLVSELEQAIGKPVTLARLSLGWRQGVALQLDGLAVFDDAVGRGEPTIQVESVSALVALAPLLHKDVQVASIILRRPRIHVSRNPQGVVNLTGLAVSSDSGGRVPRSGARERDRAATGPARESVSFQIRSLRIEDGALHWTDAAAQPPAELWVKKLDVTVTNIAPGQPMDVEMQAAIAGEQPNLRLSGRLTPPGPSGSGSLERMRLVLDDVPLEQVVPPARPGEPQLRGRLSLSLDGAAPSLDPQTMMRAVSASGRVKLADPVVANLNILRAVFEKFSMIPGLVDALRQRLPPEYQAKFDAKDTVLRPVDLATTLEGGILRFADVHLQTDTFGITGSGQVGLDGFVQVQSVLRIDPDFSQALIKSVNELQYLTNREREMEIPMTVQGRLPRLVPVPDLQYVASRVIVNKATDLLNQWLTKQAPSEEPPSESQPSAEEPSGVPPESPGEAGGALLGQFLRRTLQQQPDSSPQPSQPQGASGP